MSLSDRERPEGFQRSLTSAVLSADTLFLTENLPEPTAQFTRSGERLPNRSVREGTDWKYV